MGTDWYGPGAWAGWRVRRLAGCLAPCTVGGVRVGVEKVGLALACLGTQYWGESL